MKAIETKFHGATNTRGARISATDSDGNRVYISYPYELSGEEVHRKAVDALCEKMKWTGKMVSGQTRTGYVFVFTGTDWAGCTRASNRIADVVYAMHYPGDAQARLVAPTATWAEIIANELGIDSPDTR